MKNYNSYQTLNNPNSSQCVSNKFPSSSQCVPNMFLKFSLCSQYVAFKFSMGSQICSPKFPMCSGTCSPYHLTFIPYALANVVLLVTYIAGPKERNSVLQSITFYFGEPLEIYYYYYFWSDGPIKLAKKTLKKTWEAPHLINRVNRRIEIRK